MATAPQIDAQASTAPPPAVTEQRPWLRRALAWFRLLHPFPSLVVAATGWAYPFGAMLALALHLANALPDDKSDREASAGGMVQSLGRPVSLVILFLSFSLTLVFGLVVSYLASGRQLHGLAVLLGGVIGLVALALASRPATDRAAFPLLAVGSALLAIGVAAALLA